MGNLPEKVFKVMTIKVIKELVRKMNEQREKLEAFIKELKNIRKPEMKDTTMRFKKIK